VHLGAGYSCLARVASGVWAACPAW
jgi:hypothetical protein